MSVFAKKLKSRANLIKKESETKSETSDTAVPAKNKYYTYDLQPFIARYTNDIYGVNLFRVLLEDLKSPLRASDGPWVCGGAVRRTLLYDSFDNETDVDFYFKSKESMEEFISSKLISQNSPADTFNSILKKGKHISVATLPDTKWAKNFKVSRSDGSSYKVQCITLYYNTIEEVLDSFNLTLCQVGFDGINLIASQTALWDIASFQIIPTFGKEHLDIGHALRKYAEQGFSINPSIMGEFIRHVARNPNMIKNFNYNSPVDDVF